MLLLVAVLVSAAAVFGLWRLPATSGRGRDGGPALLRPLLVGVLLVLPLLYAGLVLAGARERLRVVRFDYEGKQLAFGPGVPLTAGGSPAVAEEREDLHAPRLGPRVLALEASGDGEGDEAATAVLRLASPSPVVRVDGRALNSLPLDDGDEVVLAVAGGKGDPVRLVYRGGALHRGEAEYRLEGRLSRLVRGAPRAVVLADVLAALAPGEAGGGPHLSAFYRPEAFGPWHLLLRSRGVSVERPGDEARGFSETFPVPADFHLDLQIILNGVFRSVRSDRLRIAGDRIEVRFDRPGRWVAQRSPGDDELVRALVVPSAFARQEMIELAEPSSRFRGLTALFRHQRGEEATLRFLGDEVAVDFGGLYALGEGRDRLLVRIDRETFPWRLLADLALLALYLAVFCGRSLTASPALGAVVGPVGLLLANRLLFSHKAALQPPDFALEPYAEARLALWLVPAALLFGWSVAWLVRRAPAAAGDAMPLGRHPLRWPLAGLVVAAGGCLLAAGGVGGRGALALVPLAAAGGLAALAAGMRRPPAVKRLERLRREGIPWRIGSLVVVGLAIALVRGLLAFLGMRETLRVPGTDFRLLWTALHLPLSATVVALTVVAARGLGGEGGPPGGGGGPAVVEPAPGRLGRARRALADLWYRGLSLFVTRFGPAVSARLGGVAALWVFLALAFGLVAFLARDLGLLVVHALPVVVALLLLAGRPPGRLTPAGRAGFAAALVLAVLPLVTVAAANLAPGRLVALVGWGEAVRVEGEGAAAPVRDEAARLSSERAQQLFRLHMLANPARLSEVGLQPSERVAVHYSTLQSFARLGGALGAGYLAAPLPRYLSDTYLSDLVPTVFVLTELGKVGLLGLALAYLLALAAAPLAAAGRGDPGPLANQGRALALLALLTFVLPSLYMILANLNLVLFTGKNSSLLALNSLSDVLESGALLGLAAAGLGLAGPAARGGR